MTGRSSISTHVLDTERGEPAGGVPITLARREGTEMAIIATAETDADGRIADLLGAPLEAGAYRLSFDVAAYFLVHGGNAPFLTHVQIDFQVSDVKRHYHVPLLLSRYSCASYRGS
jgi:5-hydroxyisourate hydrolase